MVVMKEVVGVLFVIVIDDVCWGIIVWFFGWLLYFGYVEYR